MLTSSWAGRTGWFLLLCAFCDSGCFRSSRGVQLYPGPPRNSADVAKLTGHVQSVDGKDVRKRGSHYELLPGCHVVVTPATWGRVGEAGGVVANTGPLVYAIPMLAGHTYSIEVRLGASAGSPRSVSILAKEMDAQGQVTGTFSPSPDDPTCERDHRGGKETIVAVPGAIGS